MTCPNCGKEIPEEVGQHAVVPSAAVVDCPHCGERVTLAEATTPVDVEGRDLQFAGHETVDGVMEEIDEKEQS
jgi:DNA-directed RNA polymerase subunit RPC12/RpoP